MNVSGATAEVMSLVDEFELSAAAQTDACILFTGPSAAKTVAERIHSLSGWRFGQFEAVDCGLPEPQLERRLFELLYDDTHMTGDGEPRPRLLQAGTILLHEVGKLSMALQVRLSDALGSSSTPGAGRRLRKRIMASTSEPLLQRVVEGTFDDRLYYRLNVIHLVLPAPRAQA